MIERVSDERLRELRKRWLETRLETDETAWLAARLRAGELPWVRLRLAALLGHGPAREVLGPVRLPLTPFHELHRMAAPGGGTGLLLRVSTRWLLGTGGTEAPSEAGWDWTEVRLGPIHEGLVSRGHEELIALLLQLSELARGEAPELREELHARLASAMGQDAAERWLFATWSQASRTPPERVRAWIAAALIPWLLDHSP